MLNDNGNRRIINWGLKMYRNSTGRAQNYFYIKRNRKKSLLWCNYKFISDFDDPYLTIKNEFIITPKKYLLFYIYIYIYIYIFIYI